MRKLFVAFGVAITIAACSRVPHYNPDPRIKPADVAKRVYCELALAKADPTLGNLALSGYEVAFSLSLKVETNLNPNVKADWVIPYHLTDTFTSGASAGFDDYVLRDSSLKYSVNIAGLKPSDCPVKFAEAYASDQKDTHISYGSFGIWNWLSELANNANNPDGKPPILDSYTVKFAVTANANPAPGFKIVNLSGNVNLPIKRIDTHTLDLAFSSNLKPTPKPQKVCVTNMPGAKPCDEPPAKPLSGTLKSDDRVKRVSPRPAQISPELDRKLDNLRLRDILRP